MLNIMAGKYPWLKALPQFEMFLRTWTEGEEAVQMGRTGWPVSPQQPRLGNRCVPPHEWYRSAKALFGVSLSDSKALNSLECSLLEHV